MTYQAPRDDQLEFKVREDQSIDIGRSDKDDFKRQSAESRSGMKGQMLGLKEQVMSGELGAKAREQGAMVAGRMKQLGLQGVEKAKEAIEVGRVKVNEMQQQRQDQRKLQSEQPGSTLLPADASGMFSPVARDSESATHRPVHHTSAADFSFSSIPDSGDAAKTTTTSRSSSIVRDEETQPLLSKQLSSSGGMSLPSTASSGDPIPSVADMPEAQGMDAAAGWEHIKALAEPQIKKAESLYSLWKGKDKEVRNGDSDVTIQSESSSAPKKDMMKDTVKPALDSVRTQAQQIYSEQVIPAVAAVGKVYAESVQPKIESTIASMKPKINSTIASVQKQAGVVREDGLSKTMDKAGEAYKRRAASTKASVINTYESKVPEQHRESIGKARSTLMQNVRFGWNKALDVWEGQEPVVKAYVHKGVTLAKKYKMETPIMALGCLLMLWASLSFIGWLAFPATPNKDNLPVLYQPQFHPSTGPIQGADLPTLTDKLKMGVDGLDNKLRDGMADLRDSGAAQLRDIKDRASDALPSMDQIKEQAGDLKDRATDLKDRVVDRMPSLNEIKGQAADVQGRVLEKMPSSHDIRQGVQQQTDRMPSMDDIKARAADGLESARTALKYPQEHVAAAGTASPTLQKINERVGGIKDSDIGLKVQDRLHHMADAIPTIPSAGGVASNLRQRVVNLKDRIVSSLPGQQQQQQQHHAVHSDVIDPENHVIEEMDSHKHVKETLNV